MAKWTVGIPRAKWEKSPQVSESLARYAHSVMMQLPNVGEPPSEPWVRRVNIHFTDFPYQPYQIFGIPYGDAPFLRSGAEAAQAAAKARGAGVALLVEDLKAAEGADAAFIFGDFNEPSHRDWTARTAAAGRHPFAVEFPTAGAVEAQGFVDAYRAAHPDEVAKPGYTWEAIARPADVEVHHDRIDFVFARGASLAVEQARIFGEKSPEADFVVMPWPSDHRAVAATVRF